MTDLTAIPGMDPVYQLETADQIIGGVGGIANAQAQALLNRTEALNQRVSSLENDPITLSENMVEYGNDLLFASLSYSGTQPVPSCSGFAMIGNELFSAIREKVIKINPNTLKIVNENVLEGPFDTCIGLWSTQDGMLLSASYSGNNYKSPLYRVHPSSLAKEGTLVGMIAIGLGAPVRSADGLYLYFFNGEGAENLIHSLNTVTGVITSVPLHGMNTGTSLAVANGRIWLCGCTVAAPTSWRIFSWADGALNDATFVDEYNGGTSPESYPVSLANQRNPTLIPINGQLVILTERGALSFNITTKVATFKVNDRQPYAWTPKLNCVSKFYDKYIMSPYYGTHRLTVNPLTGVHRDAGGIPEPYHTPWYGINGLTGGFQYGYARTTFATELSGQRHVITRWAAPPLQGYTDPASTTRPIVQT